MTKSRDYAANCTDRVGILTFRCADNFSAVPQAHGLPSWLNSRRFDAFMNHSTASVRIESLLECTGLTGRMTREGCVPDMEEETGWTGVERLPQPHWERSMEFLRRSLSSP